MTTWNKAIIVIGLPLSGQEQFIKQFLLKMNENSIVIDHPRDNRDLEQQLKDAKSKNVSTVILNDPFLLDVVGYQKIYTKFKQSAKQVEVYLFENKLTTSLLNHKVLERPYSIIFMKKMSDIYKNLIEHIEDYTDSQDYEIVAPHNY